MTIANVTEEHYCIHFSSCSHNIGYNLASFIVHSHVAAHCTPPGAQSSMSIAQQTAMVTGEWGLQNSGGNTGPVSMIRPGAEYGSSMQRGVVSNSSLGMQMRSNGQSGARTLLQQQMMGMRKFYLFSLPRFPKTIVPLQVS